MPRSAGIYTLPQSAFVSGTTISSAAVNSDFSDIATALTGSLASDGTTTITGVFKFLAGSSSTPSVTFATDTASGLCSPATSKVGIVAGGLGQVVNGIATIASSAAISAAGSGYAVNDQITLTGGTNINPVVLQVLTLSGSGVATVSVVEAGRYITQPSNPVAQGSTTGSGLGATFTVTWSATSVLALTDLNNAQLWQALGGTAFFKNNIVNANSIAAFLGSGSVTAYNLASSALGFNQPVNLQLSATVGTNLLTVAVKTAASTDPTSTNPVVIPFRDSTLGNGDPVVVSITSALSISTFSTSATLGTQNNTAFRYWVVCFNNGGTPVLALWQSTTFTTNTVNGSSVIVPTATQPLDESATPSSTAMSAGSTSAGVFYTPNGTTVTSKAFRILGYVEYGFNSTTNNYGVTTAGTLAQNPTKVQLYGPGSYKPGSVISLYGNVVTSAVSINNSISAFLNTANICPISSMGLSIMAQAVTPAFPGNIYEINSKAMLAVGTAGGVPTGTVLFQDPAATGTSALTASYTNIVVTGFPTESNLTYRTLAQAPTATVTSSTNFIVKGGGFTGGAGLQWTFNGVDNSGTTVQNLNGANNSFLYIKEIMT